MCCYNIWRRRHHTYMHTAYEKREWVSIHCWLAFVYSLYSLYARCSMPMLLATGCWLASYVVSYNCPLSFHRQHVSVCVCACECVSYVLYNCEMVVAWWWLFASHTPTADAVYLHRARTLSLSLSHSLTYLFHSRSLTLLLVCPFNCLLATRSLAHSLARPLVCSWCVRAYRSSYEAAKRKDSQSPNPHM